MDTIQALGYIGLALILLIENLFPPIPSELVLPLAGFLVSTGELSFWGAVAAATFGAVVGAWILYGLGRWGGRPVILRYGHILRVSESDLERADGWFERYGDWVVLVARIIPVARSIVSIPAGTTHMPLLRFTILTLIGTGVWNIILIYAGTILGENWQTVSDWASRYSDAILILAIVAALAYAAFRFVRHTRKRTD